MSQVNLIYEYGITLDGKTPDLSDRKRTLHFAYRRSAQVVAEALEEDYPGDVRVWRRSWFREPSGWSVTPWGEFGSDE